MCKAASGAIETQYLPSSRIQNSNQCYTSARTCLWALNENFGFCWAFLQHQALNWSQGWSPHRRSMCVAGVLLVLQGFWAGQASSCLQWDLVSWDV